MVSDVVISTNGLAIMSNNNLAKTKKKEEKNTPKIKKCPLIESVFFFAKVR